MLRPRYVQKQKHFIDSFSEKQILTAKIDDTPSFFGVLPFTSLGEPKSLFQTS